MNQSVNIEQKSKHQERKSNRRLQKNESSRTVQVAWRPKSEVKFDPQVFIYSVQSSLVTSVRVSVKDMKAPVKRMKLVQDPNLKTNLEW